MKIILYSILIIVFIVILLAFGRMFFLLNEANSMGAFKAINEVKVIKDSNVRVQTTEPFDYKKAKPLFVVKKGEIVTVLDIYGDYIFCAVYDKKTNRATRYGFIYFPILTPTESKNIFVVGKKGCTLRKGAKSSSKALSYIYPGTRVRRLYTQVTWYKIRCKKGIGWIFKKNVSRDD